MIKSWEVQLWQQGRRDNRAVGADTWTGRFCHSCRALRSQRLHSKRWPLHQRNWWPSRHSQQPSDPNHLCAGDVQPRRYRHPRCRFAQQPPALCGVANQQEAKGRPDLLRWQSQDDWAAKKEQQVYCRGPRENGETLVCNWPHSPSRQQGGVVAFDEESLESSHGLN